MPIACNEIRRVFVCGTLSTIFPITKRFSNSSPNSGPSSLLSLLTLLTDFLTFSAATVCLQCFYNRSGLNGLAAATPAPHWTLQREPDLHTEIFVRGEPADTVWKFGTSANLEKISKMYITL